MLSLLGSTYGRIIDLRNALYDRGVLDTFDLGARTISIGNITTGGTGKTPLVAYVADILAVRGEKVCILTRGYGRENEKRRVLVSDGEHVFADFREAGDEPVELAQKLLGKAIVIADTDRVAAAEWAKRKFGITAFVLDDGFQHRRARRDVDIVCVDATDAFGGGKMLPAGGLREPLHDLARADIVVITRTNLIDDISDLKFEISKLSPDAKVFEAANEFQVSTEGGSKKRSLKDQQVLAFCGIGNPQSFFEELSRASFSVAATRAFPDHHRYNQNDIEQLEKLALESAAELFVTTAKDAVKLSELRFEIPYFVVKASVKVDDPEGLAKLL